MSAPAWARVAVDAGYFDQSHLVREYRALCGLTPGALEHGADGPVRESGRSERRRRLFVPTRTDGPRPRGADHDVAALPSFAAKPGPVDAIPDSLLAARRGWPAFAAEPNGVLVIGRHQAKPAGPSGVVARLVLRARRDGLQRLHLGFSDCVTVFVNGRPIYAGDARYSFDNPRQEGVIGEHQALLWLPLKAGENEVRFALTEVFGGRGLIGRLEPADGAQPGR